MACDCKKRTRGQWANGTHIFTWLVNSKCETRKAEFPDNFIAHEPASGGAQMVQQQQQQQQVVQASPKDNKVSLCCVTYIIAWEVSGLQQGEIFTVRTFSVGDDSWGPFASQPAGNDGKIQGNRTLHVCKEDADCTQQPLAKFVFDKQAGGAGQPVALGSVGDIKTCKLR